MASKKDEVIGRGRTADDKEVALWGDGSLTWGRMGTVIKGSANARTPTQIQKARAAGWLVLGEISLYDTNKVSRLIAAARKIAERGGSPGDVRSGLSRVEKRSRRLTPTWTTIMADRDGKPIERIWKLPRFLYGGLAVFDLSRDAQGRGHYRVMREIGRSGTYVPTGDDFHDLDALSVWLHEERGRFLKSL